MKKVVLAVSAVVFMGVLGGCSSAQQPGPTATVTQSASAPSPSESETLSMDAQMVEWALEAHPHIEDAAAHLDKLPGYANAMDLDGIADELTKSAADLYAVGPSPDGASGEYIKEAADHYSSAASKVLAGNLQGSLTQVQLGTEFLGMATKEIKQYI